MHYGDTMVDNYDQYFISNSIKFSQYFLEKDGYHYLHDKKAS